MATGGVTKNQMLWSLQLFAKSMRNDGREEASKGIMEFHENLSQPEDTLGALIKRLEVGYVDRLHPNSGVTKRKMLRALILFAKSMRDDGREEASKGIMELHKTLNGNRPENTLGALIECLEKRIIGKSISIDERPNHFSTVLR